MIICVCGYIKAGKSSATKIFAKHGFSIIESDKIVDELYIKGNKGFELIRLFYGNNYFLPKGEIDRIKLRKNVFSSPKNLRKINVLLHPLVLAETKRRIKKMTKKGIKNIIIEAPYFAVFKKIAEYCCLITCPESLHQRRCLKFKISPEMLKTIKNVVILPKNPDFIIHNDGTKKDLAKKIKNILNELSL